MVNLFTKYLDVHLPPFMIHSLYMDDMTPVDVCLCCFHWKQAIEGAAFSETPVLQVLQSGRGNPGGEVWKNDKKKVGGFLKGEKRKRPDSSTKWLKILESEDQLWSSSSYLPQILFVGKNSTGHSPVFLLLFRSGALRISFVHQPHHDVTADVDCERNNDRFHLGEF